MNYSNLLNEAGFQATLSPTMINRSFPPLTNNRVQAQTTTGAQTWWQYNANSEATWIGKNPRRQQDRTRMGRLRPAKGGIRQGKRS